MNIILYASPGKEAFYSKIGYYRMLTGMAKTPQPPYYAVIFTSVRSEGGNGYEEMANAMVEKVFNQLDYPIHQGWAFS